jgi:CysZ protein
MILHSFFRATGQIGDPRFRRVMGLGLLLSLALLFGTYVAFLLALQTFTPDVLELPLIGPVTGMHQLLGWASFLFMIGLSVFLMVPVAALFSGLFLDDIAAAVEDRHYAFLPPVPPPGRAAQLKESLNLLGLILGLNVLGLALLPLTGPLYIPAFWVLNGFLLGREYFALAALRRVPRPEMQALRRRNFWRIWLAGTLMAAPLSVPLVNLLIPVIGAATFTHLFHRMQAAGR